MTFKLSLKFRIILGALLLPLVTLAAAEPVSIKGADGFTLKGSYFQGDPGRPAVLMLHQCNRERSMYHELGEALSKKGIHALSLDFRLYGESVTEEVSLKSIREKTDDWEERRKVERPHRAQWPGDTLSAYEFLRNRAGDEARIGVIGASCGGFQAIGLAEVVSVDAFVFFSSGINESRRESYLALDPAPTLILAAQDDTSTFERAQALFGASAHPDNRLIAYKGNYHGYPLFEHDSSLLSTIVDWFERQLVEASN